MERDQRQQPQQQPVQVSIQHLDPDHHQTLARGLHNVMSTELAGTTMAQLIDGLPLADVAWNMRGTLLIGAHPLTSHTNLCEGVIEQTRLYRGAFDPAILSFEASAIQAYQDAAPGSLAFNLRLVELVASAMHQIAVILFRYEPKLHDGDIKSVVSWKQESKWVETYGGRKIWQEALYEPHPTLFFHFDYMDHGHYPDGLADIAGYWAEDRIFGGVVLFDRGESGVASKDIYFQSGRKDTTFRTWRLLDTQFNIMVDFLLADEPAGQPPLPITATDENLHRYDPWVAMDHNIYRDAWERDLPPRKAPQNGRDVVSTGDYPELEETFKKIQAHAEGQPYTGSEGSIISAPPPLPSPPLLSSPSSQLILTTLTQAEPSPLGMGPAGEEVGIGDDDDVNSLYGSLYVRTPPTQSEAGHDDPASTEQDGDTGDHRSSGRLRQSDGIHEQQPASEETAESRSPSLIVAAKQEDTSNIPDPTIAKRQDERHEEAMVNVEKPVGKVAQDTPEPSRTVLGKRKAGDT